MMFLPWKLASSAGRSGDAPFTCNTIDVRWREDENDHPLGYNLMAPACRALLQTGRIK